MTTRATGNRRLLKLAAFLRTVPRQRFDYTQWVGSNWQGDPSLSCGTSACAMGWATTMPEFRRLGLRLRPYVPGPRPLGGEVTLGPGYPNGFFAARELFGLDDIDDAGYLFAPVPSETRATPKQVAAKIERWVKDHPA